jgi:hypothetical protein
VQKVDQSSANAGLVRIGTSGTASLTVYNLGNGNLSGLGDLSNLQGSVAPSTGVFAGAGGSLSLADGKSQSFNYTYTPTSHTSDSTTVSAAFTNGKDDGSNLAQNVNAILNGQGVGPIFQSDLAPGSTLEYGSVSRFQKQDGLITLTNNSTDNLNGGSSSLTDLTILSAQISGAGASLFVLNGLESGPFTLHENNANSLVLDVQYEGAGSAGDYSALLTVTTDEGAALGASGDVYTFPIHITLTSDPAPLAMGAIGSGAMASVPEPASLAMLAAALLFGGLCWRRRRV